MKAAPRAITPHEFATRAVEHIQSLAMRYVVSTVAENPMLATRLFFSTVNMDRVAPCRASLEAILLVALNPFPARRRLPNIA
jgi:hypothetical protein